MKVKMKKFTKSQLIFATETILIGALDRIASGLPDQVSYEARFNAQKLSSYDKGALEGAGMSLAVLYAQLTDDGLGIGDALMCAGKFNEACELLVATAWENNGEHVKKTESKLHGTQYRQEDLYQNYPDAHKHAETFVKNVFSDYLK